MTARPRIGVVGLGHWGPNLLRNHHALGALAALCDSDRARLNALAAEYPGAATHGDFDALLADPGIDAVAIATPAATHGALVARALVAGKHVFVEKPLCLDLDEAAALEARAGEAGRVLMVGHLLLYHPAFGALRELVAAGALGRLRYIYANRLSLGKIRTEENALWSFAPHDISMILALTGAMPEAVTASATTHLRAGVADSTLTHMRFLGGVDAHIFVSWLHPYKEHRMVVIGSEAMVLFDDAVTGSDKLKLYRHQIGWDGDLPVIAKAAAEPVPYAADEPLRLECQAFLDAIAGGPPPPSDAAEGIRVLRVLDACQRSIADGAAVALAGKVAA